MYQGSGHKPEPFFHICRTLFYNSICQGSQCYAATRSLENKMEEYNKNDKVEEIEENISVEEENIISEEEDSRDLLLKQGAVNSLERMYKLWWIPLVVMITAAIALIPLVVIFVFGKQTGSPVMALCGSILLILDIFLLAACACVSAIAGIVLLYRYWKFLPAEEAYTTPAKVVGYLFIPVFNLYWGFVAYYKLSKSYDKLLGRNKSSCTVVACIYAILFSVSSFLGFISPLTILFAPEISFFAQLLSVLTIPCGVLYIAAMCLLQKSVRAYLNGPVSNWKNNPSFSKFPIVAGIIAGMILNFVLSFLAIAGASAKMVYDQKKKNFQIHQKQNITAEHTHTHISTHHK